MITYQPFPTEAISIVPPRDAQTDPRTSLDRLRARFARNDGLPFADVLTEARIHDALKEHGVRYRDRLFSPVYRNSRLTICRNFDPGLGGRLSVGPDVFARFGRIDAWR